MVKKFNIKRRRVDISRASINFLILAKWGFKDSVESKRPWVEKMKFSATISISYRLKDSFSIRKEIGIFIPTSYCIF